MKSSNAMALQPIDKAQLIFALDVDSAARARAIISELKEHVGAFKIGLQLLTAAGPSFVREIAESGVRVFLDVKFHDIPNTVAKASVETARLGVWMMNIHSSGGSEMMRRTVDEVAGACEKEGRERPRIIGVTVLTSMDDPALREVGVEHDTGSQVLRLAKLTAKCGLDGVVASPREVREIRGNITDPGFMIVTPGIRPDFATNDDQKRVMTPGEAVSAGADYLVVGRPVTGAGDMISAVRKILGEM
jgi:orotidine-5'-phosphate decarboxylase